jgi:hypothetical protein
VILQNSFWPRTIDALFHFECLPVQREDVVKGHERTRFLDLLRLNFVKPPDVMDSIEPTELV